MFLENATKCCAGLALGCLSDRVSMASALPIALKLAGTVPSPLPRNFVGLGYEMSSVATPGLLSVQNRHYLNLMEGLGAEGVVRVGGIVADYTRYVADGTSQSDRQNTVITRADLERFEKFLQNTGWRAIWSVNFAQGSREEAVNEARAVAEVLGTRLLALELGNEVENYRRGEKPFRPPPFNYETYRAEFRDWQHAIRKAVPGIRFAAPDTAASVEWVERMAHDANGGVQLLTTHYYRGNQKNGTAEQLLDSDPRLKDILIRLRRASHESGIPWRMCETNSFFGGGRPGVSDTFVGSLWTLDYMLLLATNGCSGVNIETGVNQLGFVSSYSPIQDDLAGNHWAGAPYYGMLAFARAARGCSQILPMDIDTHGVNTTAYALGADGTVRSAVVVNKDLSQDVQVSIKDLRMSRVRALRLHAPSADSKTGITFGASVVDSEGRWKAAAQETIRDALVMVPRLSAIVLYSDEPGSRVSN